MDLKKSFKTKSDATSAEIKELLKEHGNKKIGEVTLGQVYQGKGDAAKAKDSFTKAAKFNSLPQFNYALVRSKAEKALAT